MSDTAGVNALSIASPWNKVPAFFADATPRLLNSEFRIDQFLNGVEYYLPAVNTLRIDIDQVTLRNPVYQSLLSDAVARDFKLILNFTDPNFQERRTGDEDYLQTNTADLADPDRTGTPIELDEHFTRTGEAGGSFNAFGLGRDDWGAASPEYDPLDYLVDGWQEVMDWLRLPENAAIYDAVYGFELINEPIAYPDDPEGGFMYFSDMKELHQSVEGWGDKKILVGGLRYSARFDQLARTAEGEDLSNLDHFRAYFGDKLVWSAHYYAEGTGTDFGPEDIGLPARLAFLGDDDVIVTEMNYDADPNFVGADGQILEQFTTSFQTTDGVPDWAGWTLLQTVYSTQSSKYHYARLTEEMENDGIGMTWWSPIDIDASLLSLENNPDIAAGDVFVNEERDAVALANNMWAGNDATAGDGSGGTGEVLQISDVPFAEGYAAARIAFGYGGDDTIWGTDTPEFEGLPRFNRTRGLVGVDDERGMDPSDPDYALARQNAFKGDKAYGGPGDDKLFLRGGDDFGFGNDGNDTLLGGTGNDVLLGGKDDDLLEGNAGDDVLEAGDGDDKLLGGAGIDLLLGGRGNDSLMGGDQADFLFGGLGDDTMHGGAGDDRIVLEGGSETEQQATGGSGRDTFVIKAGATGRITDFTPGEDILDLSGWGIESLSQLRIEPTAEGGLRLSVSGQALRVAFAPDAGGVLRTADLRLSLVISGTDEADELFGTDSGDIINGLAGDDTILAGSGNDVLRSGPGFDRLYGEGGNDLLVFEEGNEHRQMGSGGQGRDVFAFEDGAKARIRDFEQGEDRIDVSAWGVSRFEDLEFEQRVPGRLFVKHGDNEVRFDLDMATGFAFTEEDFILAPNATAGDGDETIDGGDGDEVLDGGLGNDVLGGSPGRDTLIGGEGIDRADYSASPDGVSVDLETGTGRGGEAEGDRLDGIEAVTGSAWDDHLHGDAGDNRLDGGAGRDTLSGGAGRDTLSGDDGNDTLRGGEGADQLSGGAGVDLVDYSDETNRLYANLFNGLGYGGSAQGDRFDGVEAVAGGSGDDVFLGDLADNHFTGGNGNDTIIARPGDDLIEGGAGADILVGGAGVDTASYAGSAVGVTADLTSARGAGADANGDWLHGIENLRCSAHADALRGDTGSNTFEGGGGSDWINGEDGDDMAIYAGSGGAVHIDLIGGRGYGGDAWGDRLFAVEGLSGSAFDDVLLGDTGDNTLDGGDGGDSLIARAGDDLLRGGDGGDALVGGAGSDWITYDDAMAGVTIDLTTNTGRGDIAEGDRFHGIENVIDGRGDDHLIGNAETNILAVSDGDDVLEGGGGADIFVLGAGYRTGLGANRIEDFNAAEGDRLVLGDAGLHSGGARLRDGEETGTDVDILDATDAVIGRLFLVGVTPDELEIERVDALGDDALPTG